MKNVKIREAAKRAGVYLWEIAERYGCNDGNFSRKLRRELPAAEQEKINCHHRGGGAGEKGGCLMSDVLTIREAVRRSKDEGVPVSEYTLRRWVRSEPFRPGRLERRR